MTLIPISSLSRAERASLGVNILTAGRSDRRPRMRRRLRGRIRGVRGALPQDCGRRAEAA